LDSPFVQRNGNSNLIARSPSLSRGAAAALPKLSLVASAQESPERKKIAMIGTGYVGLVTGTCLAQLGHSVVCVDTDPAKIGALQRGKTTFFEPGLHDLIVRNGCAGRLTFSEDIARAVRESEMVFIAVGTPVGEDGSADLSAVRAAAAAIGRHLNGPKIVVLKSTVPVGCTELVATIVSENSPGDYQVDVVSNPEFLREGCAVNDFMEPQRIVVGTSSAHAEAVMRELYAPLSAPFVAADERTSEMIKYAANAFLATKVSFINEIANICELVDVDVKTVGLGIAFDERIGAHFMRPGIGYGGSCFPKDVRALERLADASSYDAVLLRAVDAVNKAQIARAFARIQDALGGSVEGKRAGLLGLAFKPDTSDVREAPALYLIELLVAAGATVTAHDPAAMESARVATSRNVTYVPHLYEAIDECDVLILATEWDDYKNLNFRMVKKLMRGDVVFDGRNCLDPDKIVTEGLRYLGVGRAKEPLTF